MMEGDVMGPIMNIPGGCQIKVVLSFCYQGTLNVPPPKKQHSLGMRALPSILPWLEEKYLAHTLAKDGVIF